MSQEDAGEAEPMSPSADMPLSRASGRRSRAKLRRGAAQTCTSAKAAGGTLDGILMQGKAPTDLNSGGVLELPEILDLRAAAPLTAEFLAHRGRPLGVDASRVVRVGGLCLQVLLSAAITWKIDKKPFEFVNPSTEFSTGLALLGISLADLNSQDKSQ